MPVNAVIRVGDGRSFIVKDAGRARFGWRNERVVITAAHCLPFFPVGDIAVLGKPDDQVPFEQCTAYEALVMAVRPLRIADAREEASAQLLSLEGKWFGCKAQHINDGPLWITNATKGIVGGMSGSPILADDGSAIGVVSVSGGVGDQPHTEGGPNPRLAYHLPARFLPRFR